MGRSRAIMTNKKKNAPDSPHRRGESKTKEQPEPRNEKSRASINHAPFLTPEELEMVEENELKPDQNELDSADNGFLTLPEELGVVEETLDLQEFELVEELSEDP